VEAADVYLNALDNAWSMTLKVTDGLTDKDLCQQPAPGANTIAWIVWHSARVEDVMVTQMLMGQPQVWNAGGWVQKFGMSKTPDRTGYNDTPKQVAAFRPPSRDALLAYASVVRDNTRRYLRSLTGAALDEKVKTWGDRAEPCSNLLDAVLKEAQQHAGHAAFVRGLLRGDAGLSS